MKMIKLLAGMTVVAMLAACGGGSSPAPDDSPDVQGDSGVTPEAPVSAPITPVSPPAANRSPTVNAGDDLVIIGGQSLKITPIVADPDRDRLLVSWQEIGGTSFAQSLSVAPQGIASFYVAAVFNEIESFDLKVTVTDPSGASAEDFVTITVKPVRSVSGPITSDTTWGPEDGPIEVIGTLSVREGVTLTILPGTRVTVSHSDVDFLIAGTLLAHGEINNPVVFSKLTRFNPVGHSWAGLEVLSTGSLDLLHVVIDNALHGVDMGKGSSGTLGGVLFQHNFVAFTGDVTRSNIKVGHNTFYKNTIALNFFSPGGNSEVTGNLFQENDTAFGSLFGADKGGSMNIHHNHFIGNGRVITAQSNAGFNGPVYLDDNWWGTTDSGAIQAMILDGFTDPRLMNLSPSPSAAPHDDVGAGISAGFSLLDFSGFFGN